MLKSYKVRDIEIKNGLVLAPMSGVTTRPFRRLIKEASKDSVGLLITEFISVEALTRKVERSLAMMRFSEEERPFCVQIFGYDIERMVSAAQMVEAAGADIVDINCGCPAPKVVRKGGGCHLMREPDHLKQIIKAVKRSITIPLTIKIRSGWDESSKNALEIAKMAEGEGVEALAIHARTRAQLYRGLADWDLVGEVAKALTIPVLGSGDILDYNSAIERYRYGVSGMFIGRGAIANPFIFTDIVNNRKTNLREDPKLVISLLRKYIEFLLEDFTEFSAVGKVKQLVSQMCRGFEWRKKICLAKSYEEVIEVLKIAEDDTLIKKPFELAA